MVSSSKEVTADDFKMFDARAERGRAVARAIDSKTPIPYAVTVTTHTIWDFLEAMTPERQDLLRLAGPGNLSIAELAVAAHRDSSEVSRDIAKLVALGLVSVVIEANAGHGAKNIVRPLAENIEVHAAIPENEVF